jgi:hypothetical protein
MPRPRQKPTLTLPISSDRRAALQAHVDDLRARGAAAKARREAAPESGEGDRPASKRSRQRAVVRGSRRRTASLERQLARLAGEREALLAAGAYEAIVTIDRQAKDLRIKLREAETRETTRAEKLSRRGRGQTRDRFALLVGRSSVLENVHLEIADALRDEVLMAAMAGGTPGARSGQAGDGKGNTRRVEGLVGMMELGEAFWGTLGTPGIGGSYEGGRKRTIKRTCRASDGGLARAADSVRRARVLAGAFAGACADAAGDHPWSAEVAVRVILLNQGLDRAVEACAAIRISEGRRIAETVMAAGLEAVAPRLGVAV